MSAFEFEGHEALIEALRAGTLDAPGHLHRRVLEGRSSRRQRWGEKSRGRRAFVVVAIAGTIAVAAAVCRNERLCIGGTPASIIRESIAAARPGRLAPIRRGAAPITPPCLGRRIR